MAGENERTRHRNFRKWNMIGASRRYGLKFHIGTSRISCLHISLTNDIRNAVSHFAICIFLESCGWNETDSLDQLQSVCILQRVVVKCICVKLAKINYFPCIVRPWKLSRVMVIIASAHFLSPNRGYSSFAVFILPNYFLLRLFYEIILTFNLTEKTFSRRNDRTTIHVQMHV
jgi:hypothetical protein